MEKINKKQTFTLITIAIIVGLIMLLNIDTQSTLDKTTLDTNNATTNTYQTKSGKTIIKDTLPLSLKKIEAEIKSINQGLDQDFTQLKIEDELAFDGQQGIAQNSISEAEKVLARVAKDGVDNKPSRQNSLN